MDDLNNKKKNEMKILKTINFEITTIIRLKKYTSNIGQMLWVPRYNQDIDIRRRNPLHMLFNNTGVTATVRTQQRIKI